MHARTEREAQQILNDLRRKYPNGRLDQIVRKNERFDLNGFKGTLETGIDIGLLALKCSIAAATLLPEFRRKDVEAGVRELMHPPIVRSRAARWDFRTHEYIEARRKPLSHTVLVQRTRRHVYGVVILFGAVQIFCALGNVSDLRQPAAMIGFLDWINNVETFDMIDLPDLQMPPEFVESSLRQVAMARRLNREMELLGAPGETIVSWRGLQRYRPFHTISISSTLQYLYPPKLP